MGKPDALSRHSDHPRGQEDNSDVTLLDPTLFEVQASESTLVEGPETDLLNRIKGTVDFDEPVVKALRQLDSKGIHAGEWEQKDGVILHRGHIYVPRDPHLRTDILRLHHDVPTAGHPGQWKTLELVTHNYWWPGLSGYVARYIRGCDTCNRVKSFPTQKVGKLMPNKIPDC